MKSKTDKLAAWLGAYKKVAVALSGGLDSRVLLYFCVREKGADNCVAFIARAPYMHLDELKKATALCRQWGVEAVVFECPLEEQIRHNPSDRCYLCKQRIFSRFKEALPRYQADILCDGTNTDDLSDHRPGMRALKELDIKSPFLECGFSKDDIRALFKNYFPDEPVPTPNACLLTRFEHGAAIDEAMLRPLEQAEAFLKQHGFAQVRVRLKNGGAQIEVEPEKIKALEDPALWDDLRAYFKQHALPDPQVAKGGYRRGAMNSL
mgnify:CR=1 FL=1